MHSAAHPSVQPIATMRSLFGGICVRCHRIFGPGAVIAKVAGGYAHARCLALPSESSISQA